jgi:hypothetical protein
VFTWGSHRGGRLGHADATNENSPRLLLPLQHGGVAGIACGWGHTFAITTGSKP